MRTLALGFLALVACSTPPTAAPEVEASGPSLYDLHVGLIDQHGAASDFDVFRGHPVLVSMFYASCPTACPMLVERVQDVEARLSPAVRQDLRVLLVSLDPEHDDPAALEEAASRFGVDQTRWCLARAGEGDVRSIAGVLGIQYRPAQGGSIAHTSVVVLLDGDGRQVLRQDGLGDDAAPLVAAIGVLAAPGDPAMGRP